MPDADRQDRPGDQDGRVRPTDRGPRHRRRVRQGLRRLVEDDRQRARRAVSGRRRLPLRPSPKVSPEMTIATLPSVDPIAEAIAIADQWTEPAPAPEAEPAAAKDLLIIDYSGDLEKV